MCVCIYHAWTDTIIAFLLLHHSAAVCIGYSVHGDVVCENVGGPLVGSLSSCPAHTVFGVPIRQS